MKFAVGFIVNIRSLTWIENAPAPAPAPAPYISHGEVPDGEAFPHPALCYAPSDRVNDPNLRNLYLLSQSKQNKKHFIRFNYSNVYFCDSNGDCFKCKRL